MGNPVQGRVSFMHRILIVDDEVGSRHAIRRHLSRAGYDVSEAEGAEQAVRMINKAQPDLVLMDIMMPGINGIEAIRLLRQKWSAGELPVIFLSGINEKDRWVEAFEAGANDFISKIYEPNEMLARINTQLTMSGLHKQLQQKNVQLEQEKELASHMQRWLLEISDDFQQYFLAHDYQPFDRVGGDYFDFFRAGDYEFALIGDVSGHSTASALLMAACKSMLNTLAYRLRDPLAVVHELNQQVFQIVGSRGAFSTLALIRLDRSQNELKIVSAGHPPCYLLRSDGIATLSSSGLPVGASRNATWQCETHPFRVGEALFLYTDGVIEASNREGSLFGRDALESLLSQHLATFPRLIPEVCETLEQHNESTCDDDATMLLVQRLS